MGPTRRGRVAKARFPYRATGLDHEALCSLLPSINHDLDPRWADRDLTLFCGICSAGFHTQYLYLEHIHKSKHSQQLELKYTCGFKDCDKEFSDWVSCESHFESHCEKRKKYCDIYIPDTSFPTRLTRCGKEYTASKSVNRHKHENHGAYWVPKLLGKGATGNPRKLGKTEEPPVASRSSPATPTSGRFSPYNQAGSRASQSSSLYCSNGSPYEAASIASSSSFETTSRSSPSGSYDLRSFSLYSPPIGPSDHSSPVALSSSPEIPSNFGPYPYMDYLDPSSSDLVQPAHTSSYGMPIPEQPYNSSAADWLVDNSFYTTLQGRSPTSPAHSHHSSEWTQTSAYGFSTPSDLFAFSPSPSTSGFDVSPSSSQLLPQASFSLQHDTVYPGLMA